MSIGTEDALLVRGEPGIGKSHLLREALRQAPTHTVLVQAHIHELAFPLSGLSSLLNALRDEHRDFIGRHLSLRSNDPDGLFGATHDVISLIQGLNLDTTIALIDDVDLMDLESRTLMAMMAARLAGTSVSLVMTATHLDDHGPLSDLPTLEIPPLTLAESLALAEDAHQEADTTTLRIIAGYSGGNPRLLLEQIDRMDTAQASGTSWLTLPPRRTPSLAPMATSALARCDSTTIGVLGTAALAPLHHVEALEQSGPTAADSLEDLVGGGILGRDGSYLWIVDPRLRAHLYWKLDAQTRRETHALLASGTASIDPQLAAWHRSFTTRDAACVDDLLEAAATLVRTGHVRAAIELSERAMGLAHASDDHSATIVGLCSQLIRNGEIALADRYSAVRNRSSQLLEHSLDLATQQLVVRIFRAQIISDEDIRALIDMYAQARGVDAASLLVLAALYRAERWEVDEARHILAPGDHADRRSTDPKLGLLTEILDALDGQDPEASEIPALDTAALLATPPDLLLMRGRALTWRERYTEARHVFTIVLNHPTSRDRIWSDLAHYASIGNEIGAGQFRLARSAIEAWGGDSSWIDRGAAIHAFMHAWYAYSIGDSGTAHALIEQCLAQASSEANQGMRARALALRGAIALLDGDLDATVSDLRQVTSMATRFRNPTLLRHWADYVEACVSSNRHREAEAGLTALERRLAKHYSRWGQLAYARGRALVAKPEIALDLYGHALSSFEHEESPYERGRTLMCLADEQERLGMSAESLRTRLSAVAAFEKSGATAWAAKVGRDMTPTASPANPLLSAEEQEIVRQVIDGRRNREIAAALHLSVRTVELRLTHIYRTFGVASRSQLIARIHQGRPTGQDGTGPP